MSADRVRVASPRRRVFTATFTFTPDQLRSWPCPDCRVGNVRFNDSYWQCGWCGSCPRPHRFLPCA